MTNTTEGNDYILLKWGTLKGYDFNNSPEAFEALEEYEKLGACMSVMMQQDTVRQKELICIMIDKVKGPVQNDWTGEVYEDREEAKKYVMEYRNKNKTS